MALGFGSLAQFALTEIQGPSTPNRLAPIYSEQALKPPRRIPDPQPMIVVGLPITPWNRLAADYVEQAQTFKRRIGDLQPMIVVGLPITPWDRLVPTYVEQALKPAVRVNDPPPYLQVGLPITPAALASVGIDLPARRLRLDDPRQGIFSGNVAPTIYGAVAIEAKRFRFDIGQTQIVAPTQAAAAATLPAQALVEQAERFKIRSADLFGISIPPVAQTQSALVPIYIEHGLKPKYRLNDPTPYLQVGLPITPAALTSIGIDQPARRLRQDEQRQGVFSPQLTATMYGILTVEAKRSRFDVDQSSILVQTQAAVAITLPAPSIVEQGTKPAYRLNDPSSYLQVGLPVTPARLTPNPLEQALRPARRLNDPSSYLQVGLPITPAGLVPDTIEHPGLKKKEDFWRPIAVPFAIAKTPATMAADVYDAALLRRKNVEAQGDIFAIQNTLTPINLTPVYIEQAERFKTRVNDPQPLIVVNLPITPAPITSVLIGDVRRPSVEVFGISLPVAPITYQFGWAAVPPDYARRRDHHLGGGVQVTIVAGLAPPSSVATEPAPRIKQRLNDQSSYIQVGLPVTPASLPATHLEQALKFATRHADQAALPVVGQSIATIQLSQLPQLPQEFLGRRLPPEIGLSMQTTAAPQQQPGFIFPSISVEPRRSSQFDALVDFGQITGPVSAKITSDWVIRARRRYGR